MYYWSPNQSPSNIQPKLEKILKNTISLPTLAYAQREQADQLLKIDKEKRKQKIKENCFKSDISHLKDKSKQISSIEPNTNILPTNMTEVLKLAYNSSDAEFSEFFSNSIRKSHLSFIFSKT